MNKEFKTKLAEEHIARVGNVSPQSALNEIIWNSLDADSTSINITLQYSQKEDKVFIEKIVVSDDGHGLSEDNMIEALGEFGKSSKTFSTRSPAGRLYHGKLGEGRYTYFSIGNDVVWTTKYKNKSALFEADIKFERNGQVTIGDSLLTYGNSGLSVSIGNLNEDAALFLSDIEAIRNSIVKEFSPYLFAFPQIEIRLNDEKISFDDYIQYKDSFSYSLCNYQFNIWIIEWKNLKSAEIYWLSDGKTALFHEYDKRIFSNISVYICSSFFDEMKAKGELDIVKLKDIWIDIDKFIEKSLNVFKSLHLSDENKKFIDNLKNKGIYPYGETVSLEEETNKKIFDVVALKINEISPKINTANKETQKLTYSLIKTTIEEKPSSLMKILSEVYKLTEEEKSIFAELLEKVSLSSMISTMNEVKDRLSFIEEVDKLVYSDSGKSVKERTQFQPLLLSQIWLFGEKYKYGADDINIRNILKQHVKLLGRDDIYLTEEDKKNTDFNKIPDILLWNTVCEGEEMFDSLVVEIKRPTKVIGEDELRQIKHYRQTIVSDPRFINGKHKWKFMLIGKEIDDYVRKEIDTSNNRVFEDSNSIIEVKTWASLLDDARLRYNYFKEKLGLSFKESDVTKSLDERWNLIFSTEEN